MGAAIDSVAFSATNPGSAGAAATAVTGDSLNVRSFATGQKAYIDALIRQGATEGFIEVKSPRFHDNTRGLHFITTETPAIKLLPHELGQIVYPSDALTVTVSGGTAEVDGGVMVIYYEDLPGVSAILKTEDQVLPAIVNLHPVEVDFNTNATALLWADTVITTTQNLLKANKWYAVLGYTTDVAVCAVGIKGTSTGNLRITGPGPTATYDTTTYFLDQARKSKVPYIPVFNANDRAAVFATCAAVATGAAVKVELLCAELDGSFAA